MRRYNVVGVLSPDGESWLLCLRAKPPYQGKYNLVGGKIEPGETPAEALVRECREELALAIVHPVVRTSVVHAYPDRTIRLTLLDCAPAEGAEPTALEHAELGWFTPAEMQALNLSAADRELLPAVLAPV